MAVRMNLLSQLLRNGALDLYSAVALLSDLCHCEILESRIKRRSHEHSERGRRLHRKIADFSTTILEAGNQWRKILKTLREKYFPTYPIRN